MTSPGEAYAQEMTAAVNYLKDIPKDRLVGYKSLLEELSSKYKDVEERLGIRSLEAKLEAIDNILEDE